MIANLVKNSTEVLLQVQKRDTYKFGIIPLMVNIAISEIYYTMEDKTGPIWAYSHNIILAYFKLIWHFQI